MKKGNLKKKNGFTIIEVALVLAIAGLIFLMVFITLPQLQRQQRDSRRRDDILSFLETVKKYQTNNRGALPKGTGDAVFGGASTSDKNTWQDFYNDYWTNSSVDPDGGNYKLKISDCESGKGVTCKNFAIPYSMDHTLYIYVKATCESNDNVVGASNPRIIAVLYRMEGSGTYCANT